MLIVHDDYEIDDDSGRLDIDAIHAFLSRDSYDHLLVQAVLSHPDLQGFKRFALITMDAHQVYADCGFTPLAEPERWMNIARSAADLYPVIPTTSDSA
jgi:hypothetical protein